MVWEGIVGVCMIAPFVILQISKVAIDPARKWDYFTATFACVGMLIMAIL